MLEKEDKITQRLEEFDKEIRKRNIKLGTHWEITEVRKEGFQEGVNLTIDEVEKLMIRFLMDNFQSTTNGNYIYVGGRHINIYEELKQKIEELKQ